MKNTSNSKKINNSMQCKQCVMDTMSNTEIEFDEYGVCSYCNYYNEQKNLYIKQGTEGVALFENTIQKIRNYGKGKKYDCLIGLSGGVDSSYVAFLAHKSGLKPLCVHFDNGWNSELAVMNIHSIVNKLGFDLITYVIDWEEFKDLQLAYLRASVIDIEVLTDHAIYGSIFKIAKEHKIKYVLGGHNVVTEGILPYHWTYNKKDFINIKDIHSKFGKIKLKSYPFLSYKLKKSIIKSEIEFINYLNWVQFEKNNVKKLLQSELGWRDYGGKHFESIWTRFYQGYILPTKFGVDKRKAHLSSLICSGQVTKDEAIIELQSAPYDPDLFVKDYDFVLKKLGLTCREFEEIMKLPIKSHYDFEIEGSFFNYYPIFKPLQPFWRKVKEFFKRRNE